jgi:hypothetical protein
VASRSDDITLTAVYAARSALSWRFICGSNQPEADLHAFVMVHSPSGTDAALEEVLTGTRPPLVTDAVRHQLTWRRSDGTLLVRSWSDDAACPWRVSPVGDLFALAGEPISMRAEGTVLDRLEADDARSFLDAGGFRNHFAALSLRSSGPDGGWLSTDPYGLHTVYRATVGEQTVLGNDPQLVAAVGRHLGASLGRSESAAAINSVLGHLSACRTGFDGVEALPLGHGVDFVGGAARVARRVRDPWTVPEGRLDEDLVDAVDADLTSFMARIMHSASPIRSELTGGKDSRLVLALVDGLGLAHRADFVSYGPDDHPDVVIARHLCQRLGLSWRRREWPPHVDADVASVVRNARMTGGQLGVGHVHAFDDDGGITLSGMMGETMMTNFPNRRAGSMTQTVDSMRRAWESKGRFLRPEVRRAAVEAMVADVMTLEDRGCPPASTVDAWYIESRIRRWLGARPTRWQGCVFPLYSPAATEAAFVSGRESRCRGDLLMALLDRRPARFPDIELMKAGTPPIGTRRAKLTAALDARLNEDPALRATLAARLRASAGAGDHGPPSLRTHVDELLGAAPPSSRAFDVFDTDAMTAAGRRFLDLAKVERKDLQNSCVSFAWLAGIA